MNDIMMMDNDNVLLFFVLFYNIGIGYYNNNKQEKSFNKYDLFLLLL